VWRHALDAAALYRDRHDVTSTLTLLGPPPLDVHGRADWQHATDLVAAATSPPRAHVDVAVAAVG
jgi:hypothetical protein